MKAVWIGVVLIVSVCCVDLDINVSFDVNGEIGGDVVNGDLNLGTVVTVTELIIARFTADMTVLGDLRLGDTGSKLSMQINAGVHVNVTGDFVMNGFVLTMYTNSAFTVGGNYYSYSANSGFGGNDITTVTVAGDTVFASGFCLLGSITSFTEWNTNSMIIEDGARVAMNEGTITLVFGDGNGVSVGNDAGYEITVDASYVINYPITGNGTLLIQGEVTFDGAEYVDALLDADSTSTIFILTDMVFWKDAVVESPIYPSDFINITFASGLSIGNNNMDVYAGTTMNILGNITKTFVNVIGIFDVQGDFNIYGQNDIYFSPDISFSQSASATISTATIFQGDMSLAGSSQIIFDLYQHEILGDFLLSGTGLLVIKTDSAVHISGNAVLADTTTYQIPLENEYATNILTVDGQASLGGQLDITTDIILDPEVEIVIIRYGSRLSNTEFNSVVVSSTSGKRATQDSQIVYYPDRAAIKGKSADTESTVGGITDSESTSNINESTDNVEESTNNENTDGSTENGNSGTDNVQESTDNWNTDVFSENDSTDTTSSSNAIATEEETTDNRIPNTSASFKFYIVLLAALIY